MSVYLRYVVTNNTCSMNSVQYNRRIMTVKLSHLLVGTTCVVTRVHTIKLTSFVLQTPGHPQDTLGHPSTPQETPLPSEEA